MGGGKPERGDMANLKLVLKQLKQEKKRATKELERLEEAIGSFGRLVGKTAARTSRKLSAAGRRRIAAAQRARWAKLRAK
jgi:hypothetical protein